MFRLYQFIFKCHLITGKKTLVTGKHWYLSGKIINQKINPENEPVRRGVA